MKLLIMFGIIYALAGIRILPEYRRAVVFRLGRFRSIRGPGLYWILPLLEWQRTVDVRTATVDVAPQEVITKDSVTIKINPVLWYRVFDPAKAVLTVQDYRMAVAELSLTTLRSVIGQHPLDEVLKDRNKMQSAFLEVIDHMTGQWGIKIEVFEMKDVELPVGMQRAMAQEAEAMREKRARLIKAEAEQEASEKLSLGAKELAANPMALELRRMQMLTEIGAEQNSTVVILMPSEFVQAAGALAQKLGKAA